MNKKTALQALTRANEVLTSLGVRWWIDCGTLLGAIRDGDFMPHDLDVDLGCWDHTRADEIHRAMLDAGFTELSTYGTPDRGYEQRYKWFNVKLDIFYFYKGTFRKGGWINDPTKCWQGSYTYPGEPELIVQEFPRNLTKTKRIDFLGLSLPAPEKPEAWLEVRYGDWRTVKTVWDYQTDPPCIVHDATPDDREALSDTTVVIKTFMRPKLAVRAVRSIRATYKDCEVLVVDDSNAPPWLERQLTKLDAKLLRLPYDSGLSAGRNRGIEQVTTKYVLVMDDDMLVSTESNVPAMVKLLKSADVVCGTMRQKGKMVRWEGHHVLTDDGGLLLVPLEQDPPPRKTGIRRVQVDFGLNVLVSRTKFLQKHPWDEDLKLHEHTSWFLTMRDEAKVLFSPDCVFEHKREVTSAYTKFRRRKEFRLLFYAKHGFKYHVGVSGHRDDWTPRDEIALMKLKAG